MSGINKHDIVEFVCDNEECQFGLVIEVHDTESIGFVTVAVLDTIGKYAQIPLYRVKNTWRNLKGYVARCDDLKAENKELAGYVKRFRETLAEVAKMANNSDQEQIFEKCRDALRDVYLEEKFRDAFDKILHNPDTGKGGEDE